MAFCEHNLHMPRNIACQSATRVLSPERNFQITQYGYPTMRRTYNPYIVLLLTHIQSSTVGERLRTLVCQQSSNGRHCTIISAPLSERVSTVSRLSGVENTATLRAGITRNEGGRSIHLADIDVGLVTDGTKYLMMLRGGHSGFCWFFKFPYTSADNSVNETIDWCAAFNVPQGLMSDGPSHSKKETGSRFTNVRMVSPITFHSHIFSESMGALNVSG